MMSEHGIKRYATDNGKQNSLDIYAYKMTSEEVIERVNQIEKCFEIINSDLSDFEKAFILSSFYKNSKSFKTIYSNFVKFGINDERLDEQRDNINCYEVIYKEIVRLEENGSFQDAKYINNNIAYYKCYEYAKYILNERINTMDVVSNDDFYFEYGINDDILDFCEKCIKELDVDLYNEYSRALKEKEYKDILRYSSAVKEVYEDIQNGNYEKDGNFDCLEFLKKIPFSNIEGFKRELCKHMKVYNKEEYNTVKQCLGKKAKISDDITYRKLSIRELYSMNNKSGDYVFTDEDKDFIVNYLAKYEVLLTMKNFNMVGEKLVSGEISRDELNDMVLLRSKEEKHLIPKL